MRSFVIVLACVVSLGALCTTAEGKQLATYAPYSPSCVMSSFAKTGTSLLYAVPPSAGSAIALPQTGGVEIEVAVLENPQKVEIEIAAYGTEKKDHLVAPPSRVAIGVGNVMIDYQPRPDEKARVARAARLIRSSCR